MLSHSALHQQGKDCMLLFYFSLYYVAFDLFCIYFILQVLPAFPLWILICKCYLLFEQSIWHAFYFFPTILCFCMPQANRVPLPLACGIQKGNDLQIENRKKKRNICRNILVFRLCKEQIAIYICLLNSDHFFIFILQSKICKRHDSTSKHCKWG